MTHRSLFDDSVQGLERRDQPAFCFQGHPEASPGPHDVSPLFDRFISLMEKNSTGLTGLRRIDRIDSLLVKR
jgi:carbamoyl-phosphate synthase small subunit